MDIATIRQQYPQYSDLTDDQLAHGLHDKFYSDLPFDQFAQKIGYSQAPEGGFPHETQGPSLDQLQNNPVTFNDPAFRRQSPETGLKGIGTALNTMARTGANAATFGLADKFAAKMEPGDYEQNLAREQGTTEQAKQKFPVSSGIGTVLGLAGSPVNKLVGGIAGKILPTTNPGFAGFAQRYGNYGFQGGLTNALYQHLNGDEDQAKQSAQAGAGMAAAGMVAPDGGSGGPVLNAAKNFGKGALLGVGTAGALEGGSKILDIALSPILKYLNPEEEALAQIASHTDDLTPEMMAAKLAKRGDQGMLADVSPGLQKLGADTVQFPGDGRTFAQRQLASRTGSPLATSGGAVGRVQEALKGTLSDENAVTTAQALIEKRTADSQGGWDQLFSEPVVPKSPTLDAMAKNKAVSSAMASGRTSTTNFLNAKGSALPDTAFAVDGQPTLQAWHAAKSNLDDLAHDIQRGVIPAPEGASVSSLKALADSIRAQLKNPEVNPLAEQYTSQLDKWAGPTSALQAVDLGMKAAKGDVRLTNQLMDQLSDADRDFFRIGFADQTQHRLGNTPNGANVVKSIFNNQNQRRNLESAFDSRAEFNAFRQAIAREQNFAETNAMAFKGSPTATRALGAEELAKEIGQATVEGVKEGGAEGAVLKGGKAATAGLWTALTKPEAMRSALARNLYSRDPEKQQQVLEALKEMRSKGTIFGHAGFGYMPRASALATKAPFSFGGP